MNTAAILLTVERLRQEANCDADVPLTVETLLPRLYPVSCIPLPRLSVQALRDWFQQHNVHTPPSLVTCHDRQLRGGIVAWRGCGLLFADQSDASHEIRFTFAHEAAHFLHDHLYPRQDLLRRFGPRIQPVLNGLRPPTRDERVDALLAHANLALHTHLIGRDHSPDGEAALEQETDVVESLADAFACEVLAPRFALQQRFSSLLRNNAAAEAVCAVLVTDFHLPLASAHRYARAFVGEHGQPESLLTRLRLT